MTEREKLIKELMDIERVFGSTRRKISDLPDSPTISSWEVIADFILADRQRVLAPLVDLRDSMVDYVKCHPGAKPWASEESTEIAIDATLRLAGLTGKE